MADTETLLVTESITYTYYFYNLRTEAFSTFILSRKRRFQVRKCSYHTVIYDIQSEADQNPEIIYHMKGYSAVTSPEN
jgi:hypothetical protein